MQCRGGGRNPIRPQAVSPASPATPPPTSGFPSTVRQERKEAANFVRAGDIICMRARQGCFSNWTVEGKRKGVGGCGRESCGSCRRRGLMWFSPPSCIRIWIEFTSLGRFTSLVPVSRNNPSSRGWLQSQIGRLRRFDHCRPSVRSMYDLRAGKASAEPKTFAGTRMIQGRNEDLDV